MLEGKKAIVTGGARGIGLEIVLKFLTEGATVYFIDLNPSEFLERMQAAAKEGGGEVFFKQANVAVEEKVVLPAEPVSQSVFPLSAFFPLLCGLAAMREYSS